MKLSLPRRPALLCLCSVLVSLPACVASAPSRGANAALHLAPSGPMAEFEERRAHAFGRFITEETLRDNELIPLTELLRLRIPGFGTARDARGLAALARTGCVMDVFVDGLFAPSALDGLQTHDVAGVEYYDAASVPPRYRRPGTACPALLLWTRR